MSRMTTFSFVTLCVAVFLGACDEEPSLTSDAGSSESDGQGISRDSHSQADYEADAVVERDGTLDDVPFGNGDAGLDELSEDQSADGPTNPDLTDTVSDQSESDQSEVLDAASSGCAAMDAEGVGDCVDLHGFAWDGADCVPIYGCSCSGSDCGNLYRYGGTCFSEYSDCQ
ncbi:MAG: hypothetical protein KC561_10320 [Myxococcales bacterium]|nr:hypothetical protein [Myxococcales bacterium]